MLKLQTTQNKKGEIHFRRQLLEQLHTNTYPIIEGQPTEKEYMRILKDRVTSTRLIFKDLQKRGVVLSPFLEIGAERGQRAMLLLNKFGAEGFMLDISYESLKSADLIRAPLRFPKMPIRLCADTYTLPFASGSIPFVFCFQTLHHFPDPYPILSEIKRVLAPGGFLYFNEEPIAQLCNLNLWRRDLHLQWYETMLKALGILHFVSRIGKSEVEHHILEESFNLDIWERALNLFPKIEAHLIPFPFSIKFSRMRTKTAGWLKPSFFKTALLNILGGGIEALCQKESNGQRVRYENLFDLLGCPDCSSTPRLSYQKKKKELSCTTCSSIFVQRDDIFMLFAKRQEKKLYPQ